MRELREEGIRVATCMISRGALACRCGGLGQKDEREARCLAEVFRRIADRPSFKWQLPRSAEQESRWAPYPGDDPRANTGPHHESAHQIRKPNHGHSRMVSMDATFILLNHEGHVENPSCKRHTCRNMWNGHRMPRNKGLRKSHDFANRTRYRRRTISTV